MPTSTITNPLLIGTVKNSLGSTATSAAAIASAQAGTVRNMGGVIVGQFKDGISYNDAAASYAFTIPAGSMITSAFIIQTSNFTGSLSTIALFGNGVQIAQTQSISTGNATNIAFTPLSGYGKYWINVSSTFPNVSPTDQAITYTMAGSLTAGTGTLVMQYMVRNLDGTISQSYAQA